MKLRPFLIALALGVPLFAASQPAAPTFKVTVGPTALTLPVPAGFKPMSADSAIYGRIEASLGASGNRMLALLLPAKDAQLMADGQPPAMTRYVMLQTLKETEASTFSAKEMTEAKNEIRTQYKTLFAKMQPKVQSQLDYAAGKLSEGKGQPEMSLMLGETRPLEIFDERPLSISFLTLSKITIGNASTSREVPLATASTTMAVKGKLIYFLVYSVYEGQPDLAWARKVTTDWLATVR